MCKLTESTATYTTKEFTILPAKYMKEKSVYTFPGYQAAALIYKNLSFISFKYIYQEEKRMLSNGKHKYVRAYEERLREYLRSNLTGFDNFIVDGTYTEGYHGYSYNVLDCFLQFINYIKTNSRIVSVRNGEDTTRILEQSLDPTIPDLYIQNDFDSIGRKQIHLPETYIDYKKQELIKQVKETCARKNITIDLSPWYEKVVSKIKIGESIYRKVKPFEGDLMEYKRVKYHIIYADGYETDTFKDTLINNYG